DKELVALDTKGGVTWTSKLDGGSRPDYMTKIDNTIIVHHNAMVEAFNATDGAKLWQKKVAGAIAMSPDRSRLLVGDGTTMLALRPSDGSEIGRLEPLPAVQP
ncbi:MAG TPA: PQQ-binding-like beta-propeller repeat protein, partial [Kofleriaceae bacterium]|nr:PQQ-binding-like beta-propeller repeat protein [Kofleriaceae bacterium]